MSVKKCWTTCSGVDDLTTIARVNDNLDVVLNGSDIFPETFEGFRNTLFNVVTKHVSVDAHCIHELIQKKHHYY